MSSFMRFTPPLAPDDASLSVFAVQMVESLNVSVAAGVCLFEARRRRN